MKDGVMKKKNYLWIWVLILGLLPVLSGCSSEAAPLEPGSAGTLYGNTAGNLLNGGYMVEGNDGYVYSFSGELGDIDLVRIRNGQAETITRLPDQMTAIHSMNYWDQALYFIAESTTGGTLYCYDLAENKLNSLDTGTFHDLMIYDGQLITFQTIEKENVTMIARHSRDMANNHLIYKGALDTVFLHQGVLYAAPDNFVRTIYRFDCEDSFAQMDSLELDLIMLNEGIDDSYSIEMPYENYLFFSYRDEEKYNDVLPNTCPYTLLALNLEDESVLHLGDVSRIDAMNIYQNELYVYNGNASVSTYGAPGTLYRISLSDKIEDIQTVVEDNLFTREQQAGVIALVMNKGLFTTSDGLYFEANIRVADDWGAMTGDKLLSTFETSKFDPETNDLVLIDNVFGIDRVTE